MLDNATPVAQQQDGSLESALAQMPDIEALEAANPDIRGVNEKPRDDGGRFKQAEAEPAAEAAPVEDVPEVEDDDPFVEFPDAEGKEPVRAKLSEVWDGYTKAKTLETELQKAKTEQRAMLPHEVEGLVTEVNRHRQQLIQQLQHVQRMSQVQPPSLALINNASPDYNPELYHAQTQEFLAAKNRAAEVAQQIEAQQAASRQEQEAIARARADREWQRIQQVWPEFAVSKDSAERFRSELKQHFGFDDETLNTVIDSRFYHIAKHALNDIKAQEKKAEAVKVVKAKPKLVSSVARQNVTAKQRTSADGMKRLQQSGSIEDAAAALSAFL